MEQSVPILLVEDDDIDTEIVQRALRKANVVNPLYTASDGVEALEILNGQEKLPQPCLILLDINMPRMNGFEFLQEIRDKEIIKQNVVFMLTTSSHPDDIEQAYNLQTAGYILKENVNTLAGILKNYVQINEFSGKDY